METIAACPTVREVEAETGPSAAVIFVVPTPALVAKPLVPASLPITATSAADELQVTSVVKS